MESSRSDDTTPAGSSLAALLNWARARGCALLDAQLLLARALERPRSFLYAEPEFPCPDEAYRNFVAWVGRRTRGEPLAYITGEREFWSQTLRVTPDVLVPRPETELLVERALALCGEDAARVLELGTGCGAIALALAGERPRWRITATDASPAALAVAAGNAQALALQNCEFLAGSWYEPLAAQRFELIVSNPPYIAPDDPALADPAQRHEPQSALVSPPDGLAALRAIIDGAGAHLVAGGALALEHGSDQGPAVAEMLVYAGFSHVRCHADLAGHPRISEARTAR
jgi:release factor glutamine methyltransferase